MNQNRVLIVDDCDLNVMIIEEILRSEYTLETAESGEDCLDKLKSFEPDVVLLDIMMPGMDGYETCRRIKQGPCGKFTQVILVSGKASAQERLTGYESGADDFVVKPFNHDELRAKVRIQFRLREALVGMWEANAKVQLFNAELEELVRQRSAEVLATQDLTVFALAKLAESRDNDTGDHLERIRDYCRILAEQLCRSGPHSTDVDRQFQADLYRASPLHDVGKVGIPDAILHKPGSLTEDEFEVMKGHSAIGANALSEVASQGGCGSFLDMAVDVARHHHERFDGTGYPDGLAGRHIPLAARIVALADVFDALTTKRVYKDASRPEVAKTLIEDGRGNHFDPVIVDAFLDRYDDFVAVHRRHAILDMPGLTTVGATSG